MGKFEINIAKDFSERLGGRWIKLGPFSGELFYETILKEKYEIAKNENENLNVYLDGTKGYGSSFLDQSFGELARKFGVDNVRSTIIFHTEFFNWEVKYINDEIWSKKS